MPIIEVQKVEKTPLNIEDLLARFCYYFPQYKYSEARRLPYKRIVQMLKVVQQEHAKEMYELVQIVAAPHTKNGQGVRKMVEYYQGIMEGK